MAAMDSNPCSVALCGMRVAGFTWCAALLALLPGAGGAPPAPTPSPPVALPHADAFRTRDTEHFTIWYDTGYDTLRPLTGRLEGTYDAVVRVGRRFGFPMNDPPRRLPIIVVDQYEDYASLAKSGSVDPRAALGFFDPNHNVAVFGNVLNSPSLAPVDQRIAQLQWRLGRDTGTGSAGRSAREKNRDALRELSSLVARRGTTVKQFNRLVIQHEGAHQILFALGVHAADADNPLWLVEGLATQFETAQTNPRGRLRRANQMRLADLRGSAGVRRGVQRLSDEQYAHAFRQGGLIPLRDLIADFAAAIAPSDASVGYAQSWGLVFYLARERHEAFVKYLHGISARAPGTRVRSEEELTIFEEAFGAVDDAFQRAWLSHMVSLRVDPGAD